MALRWSVGALAFPVLLAMTPGCGQRSPSPAASASPAADGGASTRAPTPSGTPDGRVSKLSTRGDVPLRGVRVEATPGDYLLQGATRVAVVSATGSLIDFGERGAADELSSVDPTLFHGIEPLGARVRRVAIAADGSSLYVEKDAFAHPVRLHAFWYFVGDTLILESALSRRATGPGPAAAANETARGYAVGELVNWGNLPTFAGGYGFLPLGGGALSARFVARAPFGANPGYAYCTASEPRTYTRFVQSEYPGYHADPHASGPVRSLDSAPEVLGERRVVQWSSSSHSLGHAAMSLPCLRKDGVVPFPSWPARDLRNLPPASTLEVRACDTERTLLRFTLDAPIELPAGCLQVRLQAPGHTPGPWLPAQSAARRPLRGVAPTSGRVRFDVVDEAGKPIPARIFVRGARAPGGVLTPDPDFGESDVPSATLQALYLSPGPSERSFPVGRYHLVVSRGFEYERQEVDLEVRRGATSNVRAQLRRVVDTRGFLAADLHLHAAPSSDAPVSLEDRVRSLGAVGVEVGVATDHNQVTDYRPAISKSGLGDFVASVIGEEVTTSGHRLGHWNVFPVAAGSVPIPHKNTTIPALVRAARAQRPWLAKTVVQLNHPRMRELGLFELLRFDTGDPKGWAARTPNASLDFDVLEVFNGDDYADLTRVEETLDDFLALVAAGVRRTAAGNSDSHKLNYHEAGYPRTYVAAKDDAPMAFDEAAFVASLRGGAAIVSGGPFIRLEVDGQGVGARVKPGSRAIHVRVEAPSWVDVSEVRLLRRGRPWKSWTGPFPAATVRLDTTFRAPLQRGDWLLVIARGRQPMTGFHRPSALPFSFTNPIYID